MSSVLSNIFGVAWGKFIQTGTFDSHARFETRFCHTGSTNTSSLWFVDTCRFKTTSSKWRKLGRCLSGQIVANTELQNKQDLPTVCRSLLFVQPTLPHYGVRVLFCFVFCQANSKAPKAEQVFPHATCNNHSFVVLFVDWSIMKLMLQLGKVQLQGLMRNIECSSQGVWVAEVPPTERVDEFCPCHPMCLAQWNDGKIILTSLPYQ